MTLARCNFYSIKQAKAFEPVVRTARRSYTRSGEPGKTRFPAIFTVTRTVLRFSSKKEAENDIPDIDALLADIEAPVLEGELRYYQEAAGAEFEDGIVVSYGNDAAVYEALQDGVALVDRSHWGRIRFSGEDRLDFLHNQSTADFRRLQPGQGTQTVLVTPQARTIDLAEALVQEKGVLLTVSPGKAAELVERFRKYVFPADRVEVDDVSDRCSMLTIMGPGADDLLRELGQESLIGEPEGSHRLLGFGGSPVIASVGTGLRSPGYSFIVDESKAGELWKQLAILGAVPMGERSWERQRILSGRPKAGVELTEEHNPLEAGLYHAVSLAKGCYIGQETIAKVHNLGAVKQQLWGIQLSAGAEPGMEVLGADKQKLGAITSITKTRDGRIFAMAYLRCKSKGELVDLEGARVTVAGSTATVIPLPFLSREFAPGDLPGKDGGADEGSNQSAEQREEEDAAAVEAKAAKMRAMQERLAAYQAQVEAAKKKAPEGEQQ